MSSEWFFTVFLLGLTAATCWAQFEPSEYCGRGGSRLCCEGRQDNCSLPRGTGLMETRCYCDSFCVHTHPRPELPDCCPDYRPVCLGEIVDPRPPPPRRCYYKGNFYSNRERFMDNCRACECIDMVNRMEIMCTQKRCMVEQSMISSINNKRRPWTAGNVTNFWGRDLDAGYNGMLGTNYSSRKVRTMNPISSVARKADLPARFDWRDRPGYVVPIEDQGFCNASWSYGIVSTLSDRLAKATNGRELGPLSYQQHRTCVLGQRRLHPCNSGFITKSWKYVVKTGLTRLSCYPHSDSTRCEILERRLASKKMVACPVGGMDKLFKVSSPSRLGGEAAIMKEIMDAGPVLATIRVFPEMFVYKRGIYDCGDRNPKSGYLHSVKIIGWGEEYINGRMTPYWIVANSWGTDWGEDGFFRIPRGRNECDVEEFVLSFYMNMGRLKKRSVGDPSPAGMYENGDEEEEGFDEEDGFEDE